MNGASVQDDVTELLLDDDSVRAIPSQLIMVLNQVPQGRASQLIKLKQKNILAVLPGAKQAQ